MKQKYSSELEGMHNFYAEAGMYPDYACNTDGRVGGTLFEFKLDDNNHDRIYNGGKEGQCLRYLRAYNAAAEPIPARTIVVTINDRTFSVYNNVTQRVISRNKSFKHPKELAKYVTDESMPGWINRDSIVAYNDLFYSQAKSQDKELFIKELSNPKVLNVRPVDLRAPKHEKFLASILDCLGGDELRRRLGAFFTPDKYVDIATEYVRRAISKVPKGNDYVIIDRFSGSGNLFRKFKEDELRHCILNTYVYSEWTTLQGLYEGRVRYIVPRTEASRSTDGTLMEGDAFSEAFINDPVIRKFVDDPKCTIIMLENPPYGEVQAEAVRSGKISHGMTQSYVKKQMGGRESNDLVNQAIWSAYEYYKPDHYVLFAPIKYWKYQHLVAPTFVEGHVCNRKFFHASEGAIALISWTGSKFSGKEDSLEMYTDHGVTFTCKKVYNPVRWVGAVEGNDTGRHVGLLISNSSMEPDFKHCYCGNLKSPTSLRQSSKYITGKPEDLFLFPPYVSNFYKPSKYFEKMIFKSSDGESAYQKDKQFVHDCFVWTCLSAVNKCRSTGEVRNELCLCQDTIADTLLDKSTTRYDALLWKWNKVLDAAKSTDEWDSCFTYGLHQICRDIDIKVETGRLTKTGKPVKVYKYPDLHNAVDALKSALCVFYDKNVVRKLFKYELLK